MKKLVLISLSLIMIGANATFAQTTAGDVMLTEVESPTVIGFKDALNQALEKNSALKKVKLGVTIAESEVLTAASRHLPKVSAVASHESLHKAEPKTGDDNAKAGLKLSTPLLDLKLLVDIKAKHAAKSSAEEKYNYEQDVLLNEVGGLYIEALIAQALKEIAFEELQLYREPLAQLERKRASGRARPFDVTRARYLSNKAYSDYLLKNQDYLRKLGDLGRKIGQREFFLLSSVDIQSPHLAKEQDVLVEIANYASDMKLAHKDISAANYSLLSEKFDFFPKLNASVDTGWQFPYVDNTLSASGNFSTRIMVNLELPLFTGGSTYAAIKSRTASRTIHELTLRGKTTEKILTVNGLKQQIKDLQMVQESARLALESATEAKASAQRLFSRGEATGLELVEANTNHFTAKNQLATVMLRLEHAKLRLLFTIGRVKELL